MLKIYGIDIRILQDEKRYAACLKRMTDSRLAKIAKIRQENDKLRSLGAGILLDYGMCTEGLTVREADIRLTNLGKPYAAGAPFVQFNISHADYYVVAAFQVSEPKIAADAMEVGIDVECIHNYKESFIRKCTTLKELSWLDTQPDRMKAMTRIWTAKESYMKCTGKGLRIPVEQLETDFPTGMIWDEPKLTKSGIIDDKTAEDDGHEEKVGAYLQEHWLDNCCVHVCSFRVMPDVQIHMLGQDELDEM